MRAEQWMGALPWGDPEQYVKHSPLFFAGNFRTPTLVIGREGDGQATELYFALRSRKVDCAMLRTADRVAELEALLGWVGR